MEMTGPHLCDTSIVTSLVKAGVHVKAVLTSLKTEMTGPHLCDTSIVTSLVKAGVHVKAVLTSLETAFLPMFRGRYKRH